MLDAMARTRRLVPALLLLPLLLAAGCASKAYRQGKGAARDGDWDRAVARYTKALEQSPDNLEYKMALESARVQASRMHHDTARKHLAASELEQALDELEIATKYDAANEVAAQDLRLTRRRIEERQEQQQRLADYEAARRRAQALRYPVPVLSPRSPVPITVKFQGTSLQKVFETLSKLSGVNILFDEGFRDKNVDFAVTGITFEEALDQLTFTNRYFYKVLDQNTIIIVPESLQKHRDYDDNLVQTFYLQNADATEMAALVTKVAAIQKVAANKDLGALTVVATPDKLALVGRILELNDKAKGEVMVELQFMEVDRVNLKRYGIELSNYEGSVTLSPTGASGEVAGGFTNVRAHLLSSLNLSDFIVSIPSTLFARFLQTDSSVKLLASPRLRAAEGKKTQLRIGTEVPVPVTTFTATQAGVSTYAPATSFNYKTVGLTFDITPKVTPGGEITLEMEAEISSLGEDRNVGTGQNPINVPTFLTRKVTGILRLRDGEATLIGGLLSTRETESLKGAFGLQSIPILGTLLGSSQKQGEQNELLISVTPHLVRAPTVTEDDLRSLYIGTETRTIVKEARPLFGATEEEIAPATPPGAGAAASPPGAAGPAATVAPAPGASPAPSPAPEKAAEPAGAAASQVNVLLRPQEISLRPGEEAAIDVVVIGAREAQSVEVELAFDPGVLEAIDLGPGPLLTLDGASVGAERSLEAGRARTVLTRPTPTSGSGAIATLRLRATRAGEAAVSLVRLQIQTPAGPRTAGGVAARVTVTP
jgi:general secretion pathway protein D